MTPVTGTPGRSRVDPGAENLDRILIAVCVAIWLAALGAGVAAIVALVDLARGHPEAAAAAATESSGTPWLLYSIIGVSAIVIAGAIPLLLRARSQSDSRPPRVTPGQDRSGGAVQRATAAPRPRPVAAGVGQPARRPGYVAPTVIRPSAPEPGTAAVDQIWLRSTVAIASAMGVATIAIGVATYLMAVDSDAGSWSAYGVAGLITVALPAIPIVFLRKLRDLVDGKDF